MADRDEIAMEVMKVIIPRMALEPAEIAAAAYSIADAMEMAARDIDNHVEPEKGVGGSPQVTTVVDFPNPMTLELWAKKISKWIDLYGKHASLEITTAASGVTTPAEATSESDMDDWDDSNESATLARQLKKLIDDTYEESCELAGGSINRGPFQTSSLMHQNVVAMRVEAEKIIRGETAEPKVASPEVEAM